MLFAARASPSEDGVTLYLSDDGSVMTSELPGNLAIGTAGLQMLVNQESSFLGQVCIWHRITSN